MYTSSGNAEPPARERNEGTGRGREETTPVTVAFVQKVAVVKLEIKSDEYNKLKSIIKTKVVLYLRTRRNTGVTQSNGNLNVSLWCVRGPQDSRCCDAVTVRERNRDEKLDGSLPESKQSSSVIFGWRLTVG